MLDDPRRRWRRASPAAIVGEKSESIPGRDRDRGEPSEPAAWPPRCHEGRLLVARVPRPALGMCLRAPSLPRAARAAPSSLEGQYEISPAALGNDGEPALCFLYAAPVCASASLDLLGVAIRTEKAKVLRSIVCVVPVLMIQD